jgi:DNA-directed RNA polymerase specialized sigma24 family protein
MDAVGSVTRHIDGCKAGDPEAARTVWDRYFKEMVQLAELEFRGSPGGGCDGEDVALSAFYCFFRNATRGRYPRLADRDQLRRLLREMVRRKARDQAKHARRRRRDWRRVEGGSPLVEQVGWEGPAPDTAALAADARERLLGKLGDEEFRQIVRLKWEGYTNGEVAAALRCALRRVERKLKLIRAIWGQEFTS